ncbi:MAG: NADH-quinone oxidoreductase subunit L [Pirellulales bacterium]
MSDLTTIQKLLILIPALPLLSAIVTALAGPRWLRGKSHLPTVLALVASCALSLVLVIQVDGESRAAQDQGDTIGWSTHVDLWTWVDLRQAYWQPQGEGPPQARDFHIDVTLQADPLTAIMLATVTFVASLVAIYGVGYMEGDRGYWRFFSYVSLFVFSMTMLVSVSNFVLLYVFWEAVGLCSYLLIGFWYEKPEAAAAGKKAFLVNRVGDFGFALALFLIWITYGTLNFHDTANVAGVLGQEMLAHPQQYVGGGVGLAICLLLLLGACGKSAQFPLHVWLPDAMEGPTPVSALIHAATMVTAGIYMITRCTPLFMVSTEAQAVVAVIGGLTALLAAIIAMTQTDLKRILAYSTISQLGYMFLGLGAGTLAGISAGMFHLFTHAFFKAPLFLGAGSVMHAMGGVIDIRRFGGLRHRLPQTHWTFLFGCLALIGFPLAAGFYSKDAIIAGIYDQALRDGPHADLYRLLFYVALGTALLTAIYTFRAFFLTFYGPEEIPDEAAGHAHESPASMTGPLWILGVLAVGAGWIFVEAFPRLLARTPQLSYAVVQATAPAHGSHGGSHALVAALSIVAALSGLGIAAYLYLGDGTHVARLTRLLRGVYWLSHGRFFFDPIYRLLVVWPAMGIAAACAWFDNHLIDGLVNLCGRIPGRIGSVLRNLQTGVVPMYAVLMGLGLLALIGSLFVSSL